MIKTKAFIYRFFAIFGLRIYLAHKEEKEYLNSLGKLSEFSKQCLIGSWQAKNGFTTVWTYKQPFFKGLIAKVKHAFYGQTTTNFRENS